MNNKNLFQNYLVYIQSITYNHAPYINDTLNGFCVQQTSFPFIAVIIDDASTDGEQDIIKDYLTQHFDVENGDEWETEDAYFICAQHKSNRNCFFSVILLKYNFYQIGKSKDFLYARWRDASKYMAFCEGDDYWIDPLKLQKQVDYLENHRDCGLVYTLARINKNGMIGKGLVGKDCRKIKFIMSENPIPTLTTLFRMSIYQNYLMDVQPEKHHWLMEDKPIWYYIRIHSKIHFVPEVTSVYRLLEESASHSNDLGKMLRFRDSAREISFFFLEKYFKGSTRYKQEMDAAQQTYYNIVIFLCIQHGENRVAAKLFQEGFRYLHWSTSIRYFLYIHCPSLWTLRMKIG